MDGNEKELGQMSWHKDILVVTQNGSLHLGQICWVISAAGQGLPQPDIFSNKAFMSQKQTDGIRSTDPA